MFNKLFLIIISRYQESFRFKFILIIKLNQQIYNFIVVTTDGNHL